MTDVPVRDAATVMLVRDGDAGMEVFMLRRRLASDFVRGAYVFPGGAVDEADRHSDLESICEGRTDAEASALLGVDAGGLAFWVAAVRECFEEAGVLLAYGEDGEVVRLDDPGVADTFAAHRRAVDHGERRLVDVCAEEGLRLAVDGIHYFSHWITPEGAPRRYDTRFFVARAPAWQEALHDDRETIANCWIRPADALARHHEGEFDLMPPTSSSLETIGRFDRAGDLLAAVATTASAGAAPVGASLARQGGRAMVVIPGDSGDPGVGDA